MQAAFSHEYVDALALDPVDLGTMYAIVREKGILKSTDGGASWQKAGARRTADANALAIDASNPSTIFAGTHDYGVLKSSDGGAHWRQRRTSGLYYTVLALAIDPGEPDVV